MFCDKYFSVCFDIIENISMTSLCDLFVNNCVSKKLPISLHKGPLWINLKN